MATEIPKGIKTALAEPSSARQTVGISKVAAGMNDDTSSDGDFNLKLLSFENLKEDPDAILSASTNKVRRDFIIVRDDALCEN